nr:MAG TPA: hypothetical protein [Caudoviricetes sp.]
MLYINYNKLYALYNRNKKLYHWCVLAYIIEKKRYILSSNKY